MRPMVQARAALRLADGLLTRLGVWITAGVGSMWCALVFVLIAVIATPGVFPAPVTAIAVWTAQVLLQLVLLSVIMVGQNVQSTRQEQLVRETHDKTLAQAVETHRLVSEMHALLAAEHVDDPQEDSP